MHTGSGQAHAFTRTSIAIALVCAAAAASGGGVARAQSAPNDLKAQDVADRGVLDSVVVYEEGAVVTRVVKRTLAQGLWAVRVTGLPEGVTQEGLQAKVVAAQAHAGAAAEDGRPRLLGLEFAERQLPEFTGTPEGVALDQRIRDLARQLAYVEQDSQQAEQQLRLVEQIGIRATANATNNGGTQELNLESVRAQLEFVAAERARVTEMRRALAIKAEDLSRQLAAATSERDAKGGASRVERSAVATLAMPTDGAVELSVSYMVGDAEWRPAYNIRAAGDRTGVQVEYDAVIQQSTGEDWNDVALSLSTATPQRRAAPPPVEPVFVDIFTPEQAEKKFRGGGGGGGGFGGGGSAGGNIFGAPGEEAPQAGQSAIYLRKRLNDMASAASVSATGTSVSYAIPRRVSIPSDAEKSQRTRIATVEPTANFVYTAQPLETEEVFLRGELTNSSSYQLLGGEADVFMGGEYIGQTEMPPVSPSDVFDVYFGPDRALKAKRLLVGKTTGASGLFGGSQTTTWSYRVTIDNGTGREVNVEVTDRMPVSRNEKIEVELLTPSAPLSTERAYVDTMKTQGILLWVLPVPATARGDAAKTLTWTVRVSHSSSVETTPLPD